MDRGGIKELKLGLENGAEGILTSRSSRFAEAGKSGIEEEGEGGEREYTPSCRSITK